MKRIIGKYTIQCTNEEITLNNFFKHDIFIESVFPITIHRGELYYHQAKIFRYSNDEKKITDVLNRIIESRLKNIDILKQLVE